MMSNESNNMNNINIYKLTPERLDDYLYFFENVAHTDNKEWDRCYCVNFCSDNNAEIAELLRDLNSIDCEAEQLKNSSKLRNLC